MPVPAEQTPVGTFWRAVGYRPNQLEPRAAASCAAAEKASTGLRERGRLRAGSKGGQVTCTSSDFRREQQISPQPLIVPSLRSFDLF